MNKKFNRGILPDIGIVALLILFPHLFPLPFYSYALVCFAAILFYLKRNGKTLRDIGLKKGGASFQSVTMGILTALLWVAFMRWVYAPFINYFFEVPDYTEYNFIREHIAHLFIAIAASWIVGGFYEEIAFRGVIHSVFEKYLKSSAATTVLSVLFTSLLFGIYHWQQGVFGVVASTLGGIFWSCIYLFFGRNLWTSILSHSIFDTITLLLIYFGLFGT